MPRNRRGIVVPGTQTSSLLFAHLGRSNGRLSAVAHARVQTNAEDVLETDMFWIDPMTYEPPPRCCDDERELMMERAHRHLAEQRRREARHRRRALQRLARGVLRAARGRHADAVTRWRRRLMAPLG